MASMAYLFGPASSLLVILFAKREATYVRWHAVQSLLTGGLVLVLLFLWIYIIAALPEDSKVVLPLIESLSAWPIGIIILYVVLAVQSYKGNTLRVPIAAGFADLFTERERTL